MKTHSLQRPSTTQPKSKQTLRHEGHEEHEVKKFENIIFRMLRVSSLW
jgi:hypothetical protein